MALTAPAAQLTLPTWDETIVPALRQRLEGESRILAKRMSVASITSADDSPRSITPSKSPHFPREYRTTPADSRKSSAIPRPSLQQPKGTPDGHDESPANSYSRPNGASSPHPPPMRARTYSQPSIFDKPQPNGYPNGTVPPTLDSRSVSPRTFDVNIRPTRIPVPMRNRTTSSSSHAQSLAPRAESRNGVIPGSHQPPHPETPQDLWVVKEVDQIPTPSTPQHATTSLMNEPAPFPTAVLPTRFRGYESAFQQPRASTDSEERPFEHWYRGDIHRNGGVGELRVAKHVEMLQIANFGHTIQTPARSQTREHPGFSEYGQRRKRAESVGVGTRESLHLDDERTRDVDMVLDERPLTDIEAEEDIDTEAFYDAYVGTDDTVHSGFSASKPELPLDSAADLRSDTLVSTHSPREDTTLARVPTARTISGSLRSESPSAGLVRSSAESTMPAPLPSSSRSQTAPRATSPVSQASDQSQTKRRAKSPATTSPASTPKKPKTKGKTPPPSSRQKEDPRHSVAVYPTPEGDIVNAIPTWTQPVQKSGNWDDVVLPVVARKKGLDGQYERADGSPRQKPPEPTPIRPAPGTFGFDYSKYKAPRGNEAIPMDEFGQVQEQPQPDAEEEEPPRPSPSPGHVPRLSIQEPKELPQSNPRPKSTTGETPPFSQYLHPEVPTISVTRPSDDTEPTPKDDEDLGAGGCCKCVIM